jgi:hypothetical protein
MNNEIKTTKKTSEQMIMELQLMIHALEKRCDSIQSEIDNMRPKMDVNPNYCKSPKYCDHSFDFAYPHACLLCGAEYIGG